jgi:hypothetical protein
MAHILMTNPTLSAREVAEFLGVHPLILYRNLGRESRCPQTTPAPVVPGGQSGLLGSRLSAMHR